MTLHPGIKTDAESTAVCAMHLWDGLIYNRISELQEAWNRGVIELSMDVAPDAVALAAICDAFASSDMFDTVGFPGVYDYEVSCDYGKWFGDQILKGITPTSSERKAALKRKAYKFFIQGDSDEAYHRAVQALLDWVLP